MKKVDRENARFAYHVLESFGFVGGDLERTRAAHLPKGADTRRLVLPSSEMREMVEAVQALRAHFPRRQAYRILRLILAGEIEKANKAADKVLERLSADAITLIKPWIVKAEGDSTLWLHWVELWDYLGAPSGAGVRGGRLLRRKWVGRTAERGC